MSSVDEDAKTFRFVTLCITMFFLGLFFFLFKVEACKPGMANCKDEFMPFDNGHPDKTCSSGAVAEVVVAPPAPKSGILCHCKPLPVNPAGATKNE